MVIKAFKRLSPLRIKQLKELETVCKEADSTLCDVFCEPELNSTHALPAFFYAFSGRELLGCLTLFLPGDGSAEISALVHPKARQSGVFSSLFAEARKTITSLGCNKVLLVCVPGIPATYGVLKKLNAKHASTEYKMSLTNSVTEPSGATGKKEASDQKSVLENSGAGSANTTEKMPVLKPATRNDLPEIAKMDALFFDSDYFSSLDWLDALFPLENTNIFKLVLGRKIIGTGAFVLENNSVSLFGIGLLPEYRGKGYGRFLVERLLAEAPAGKPVVLQVSDLNAIALSLYKKLGFTVAAEQQFWSVK